ncbi:MAG: L-serine ammonia-lyase, iron-sulfur-dependent, subunit alpha [Clostridia bacterium]|nr:L-serine ammonia-lyase, iron-sulfur-dependent, subunit alpha [Clostridia bacterium]
MSSNAISEIIHKNRINMKLSQKELGERVGVSNRAVSKWENGLSYPGTETCLKLAELFKISFDALLSGETVSERNWQNHSGMESLRELYRIGRGPSSSHSMAPEKACLMFREENLHADSFKIILYGSLAKMGKGHMTEYVINRVFKNRNFEIVFDHDNKNLPHPNTMDCYAYTDGKQTDFWRVLSVGGGKFVIDGRHRRESAAVYELSKFTEIAAFCRRKKMRIWQYVEMCEGSEIFEYLHEIWNCMKESIAEGLSSTGTLPGGLDVQKKANYLYTRHHIDESSETRENRLVCAYAFAVSEQNASSEIVVTAPTCGASGVLPAVMYYQQERRGFSDEEIVHALATAGVVGNIIKSNASISGAECGCQAEIGSACSMAAAALAELLGMNLEQIEYAAEVAMEHHLGLTCDPIHSLVQIPCIERNAVAAMRAINAVSLANFLSGSRKISFDLVVKTMYETGRDMSRSYRETSEGGLAKLYL